MLFQRSPFFTLHGLFRQRLVAVLGLSVAAVWGCVDTADAQRPFRQFDPFYRSEAAERIFFDGYAVSMEMTYRPEGSLTGNELTTTSANPLGLTFRLDYQLVPRIDLGAILDVVGTSTGRSMSLSWVTAKYNWAVDYNDYAVRLAVDPSLNGRDGFPQVDLAFLSRSSFTPFFTGDFAIGVRRVSIGYQQLLAPTELEESLVDAGLEEQGFTLLNTHAIGFEVHLAMSYNFLFDPAGSNFFIAFLGEMGDYDMLDSAVQRNANTEAQTAVQDGKVGAAYRGGVLWLRAGVEFNRPNYQIMPFLGFPFQQWNLEGNEVLSQGPRFGFRLMLR